MNNMLLGIQACYKGGKKPQWVTEKWTQVAGLSCPCSNHWAMPYQPTTTLSILHRWYCHAAMYSCTWRTCTTCTCMYVRTCTTCTCMYCIMFLQGIPSPLRCQIWQMMSGAEGDPQLMEAYRLLVTKVQHTLMYNYDVLCIIPRVQYI